VESGDKSKSPIDPQGALNNSYLSSPESKQLIGVDLTNKEIVIFRYGGQNRPYHSHVIKYNELEQYQKNIIDKLKKTNPEIKKIIKK
jgi:hypothetical protein